MQHDAIVHVLGCIVVDLELVSGQICLGKLWQLEVDCVDHFDVCVSKEELSIIHAL